MDHVPYQIARPAIQSGDLLAWTHRVPPWKSWYDFKVWAVRLFQMSEYSHVGIALWEGDRLMVLEAVVPEPRLVPLSGSLPCFHVAAAIPWNENVEKYARAFVGSDYVYSAWEAIKGWMGINRHNDKAIQCAEMVKMIYEKAGVVLEGKDDPTDVVLAVQERGGGVVLLKDMPDYIITRMPKEKQNEEIGTHYFV